MSPINIIKSYLHFRFHRWDVYASNRPLHGKQESHACACDSEAQLEAKTGLGLCDQGAPHRDSTFHEALAVTSSGRYEVLQIKSKGSLGESEVQICTRAIGLNPIDWKSVDFSMCMPEFPWVNGRELAGVVEAVGSTVSYIRPGDRVWSSTYYRKREAGCFQARVVVPAHTVLPLPSDLSFEDGACLGVPGLTAAMTLWHWLGVPMPCDATMHPTAQGAQGQGPILIWGGSTITGQFAIQLATLSGLDVIAVTSGKTSAVAQSLGAKCVVVRDGKTNDHIVAEISAAVASLAGSPDALTKAIDIVGPETAIHTMGALSSSQPSTIAALSFLPSGATVPDNITVANVQMKDFVLCPESRKYALELNRLIASKIVQLPSHEISSCGLSGIPTGLQRLKEGDMGGKKLVVSLQTDRI
ncbi:hypothetical protein PFICI_11957 [Pestalotiopsis fici W106-1]|uniref:Enoyl reductase (ER) domain-containing protein n=1 Tax=Pestalotiopsis fici (strain W106-1 / CGMCC3.15140) TaxID=1229662 RepID=W3WRS6_PESFW|nr:uncharacterized protein PFICI_11957 [Pestalotiopsis fici W106-1]ETS76570.1 hypothetical protein PFICI_11957 [Pestalotiopsis fici W106-1]